MGESVSRQLLVEVVVKYYLEDATQGEIARDLNISRPKVSRLLKKARETGVIDFCINYDCEELERLQAEAKRVFGIRQVLLTKSVQNADLTLKEVGRLAAKEFETRLFDGMTIGISWGRHVEVISKYLNTYNYQGITVVEMLGTIGMEINDVNILVMARRLCDKLNATLFPISAPIFIFNDHGRRELKETTPVKRVLEKCKECDLILTSIGTVAGDPYQTLWSDYLKEDTKKDIVANGGVGFILAHFFDKNGVFLDHKINDCVIGIGTEDIGKKKLFAVASGVIKAEAILGALRASLLDTLVTDEVTMRAVLRLAKAPQ